MGLPVCVKRASRKVKLRHTDKRDIYVPFCGHFFFFSDVRINTTKLKLEGLMQDSQTPLSYNGNQCSLLFTTYRVPYMTKMATARYSAKRFAPCARLFRHRCPLRLTNNFGRFRNRVSGLGLRQPVSRSVRKAQAF